MLPRTMPLSRSRSSPVYGGAAAKSLFSSRPKSGRIEWAEAEIAKAQKALMVTSEQMRQDAAGFMLAADLGFQDPKATGEAKMKKAKWKETREAKEVHRNKMKDIIPDDFFSDISKEVEDFISDVCMPRPMDNTPSCRYSLSPYRSPPRGGTPAVEMSDFVVPSDDSELPLAFSGAFAAKMDFTIRPEGAEAPFSRPLYKLRPVTPDSPKRLCIEADAQDARFPSAASNAPVASEQTSGRTEGWTEASSDATHRLLASSDTTLRSPDASGWQAKLVANLTRNDPNVSTPRRALLSGSVDDLLADLKEGAEESRTQTETTMAAEATAKAAAGPEELFFWERPIETEEDQEQHDVEQAVWRFRKYLRNRFGSAKEAWAALYMARKPIGATMEREASVHMADTLSIAEIKVALSRLGIKLPSVTGYAKMRDLVALIDRDNSKHFSYKELMGDEEEDPTLKPEYRERDDHRTWQNDENQQWHINWERGYFDKDMREHVISCDVIKHMGHQFKPKLVKKGEKPLWKRYEAQHELHTRARQDMVHAKAAEELEACTFKPNLNKSSVAGARVLKDRALRRAKSQTGEAPVSIRTRNHEKMIEEVNIQKDAECSFRPRTCARSELIFDNILDTGDPFWKRLAVQDKHDRMDHTSFLSQQQKAMLSFKPCTEKYTKSRERSQNVHERLFHHEKHEFWHGDKRGLHPDEEAAMSTRSRWVKKNQSADMHLGRRPSMKAVATPSRSRTPSPKKRGPAGELTIPYQHQMLGMMEACERWGKRVDDETVRQWDRRMGRPEQVSQASSAGSNGPSRSSSPQGYGYLYPGLDLFDAESPPRSPRPPSVAEEPEARPVSTLQKVPQPQGRSGAGGGKGRGKKARSTTPPPARTPAYMLPARPRTKR